MKEESERERKERRTEGKERKKERKKGEGKAVNIASETRPKTGIQTPAGKEQMQNCDFLFGKDRAALRQANASKPG